MAKQHDYILGMNTYDHDVSVCLLRDGAIAFAIMKERITREKHASGFYKEAVDYVLNAEGITLDDVSLVVRNCYILPVEEMERRLVSFDVPNFISEDDRPLAEKDPLFLNKSGKVMTISHHLAHAYSAFAASPFDEGAVMIVDGVGSYHADAMDNDEDSKDVSPLARESESYYTFRGSELKTLKKVWLAPSRGFLSDEFYNMPGLGALYSRASTYVFGDWNKCGELMGLAPYGRPNAVKPFMWLENGELKVPEWTTDMNQPWLMDSGGKWEASPSMKHWEDVAWRVQDDTEKVMIERARWLREKTGAKNLVMAGGVALNCVANGKVAREAGFDNVWIQPAAGDDGIAIGCALYGRIAVQKKPREYKITHAYFGRTYSDAEVERAMSPALVRMATKQVKSDDICRDTAKVIAEGNVIGWFQGGSEFGPRALGHRSIIADPRKPEMKDILNSRVKHRQPFRPFAPIVLAERADEIFEGKGDSPYMLMAKNVYPAWRDKIPAIVHVDGTARVQTVTEASSPRLYRLLKEFEKLTGVPVLINTSFNVKGEPIVETPKDAMDCFLTTGIHYLAIHDMLVSKSALHPVMLKMLRFYTDVGEIVQTSAKA
ncbi:MAG TPA: carbamoyltransferase C-terminal domain-containing protein [Xanthobacteraceae bacterium]|nr:carbamoyltransferase C-terminal domain-containing protein [Xanthobacteraceae bacterium]